MQATVLLDTIAVTDPTRKNRLVAMWEMLESVLQDTTAQKAPVNRTLATSELSTTQHSARARLTVTLVHLENSATKLAFPSRPDSAMLVSTACRDRPLLLHQWPLQLEAHALPGPSAL